MATYTQTHYQTNAYGRPVPNPDYSTGTPQPLYPPVPLKPYPQPWYWFDKCAGPLYSSSISQQPPIDWHRGAPHNSHYFQVLPGRLPETLLHNQHPLPVTSTGPFTPGAYYAGPAPAPPTRHDPFQHSWPLAPPLARTPPSPLAHRQQLADYVKHQNSVLRRLWISPEEFARRTQTLLLGLGQKYPDGAPEDWAHRFLDFNNQGAAGLVDKIYVSPNPGTFDNPTDLARSFHVQQGAPFYPGNAAQIPGQRSQEEQNAASATLHALNPNGGLFEQPAACTIGLSACQRANLVPGAFQT
ncbi:hypothetical protein C0992_002188 [Termitomyces sp. T32_za158]|nr:hypothetical protein C0992_002188 [Termitomyces sp. T32_za158]